ncbi:hypothetical protein GHA01_28630 [Novacetimonas hansenii]|uniref:Uncharacterized protein n=1 Tax=Novacetimonas hansenii TaxID=436 RepID=A0ABQ0SI41_NOVHA|nr:hypothetical protein Gaha_0248_002 [Novacetimonas hansenii JCM 7643]GBQ55130.1 hypothetical protein AA0243_0817 [Novacetimonas hansenii NRIC 0243]GEC65014.1 hypothetical protein GHA01_28630 [Novacetimonas hansenii]
MNDDFRLCLTDDFAQADGKRIGIVETLSNNVQSDTGIGKFLNPISNGNCVDMPLMRDNTADEEEIYCGVIGGVTDIVCPCFDRMGQKGNRKVQVTTGRVNDMAPFRRGPQCDELIACKFRIRPELDMAAINEINDVFITEQGMRRILVL